MSNRVMVGRNDRGQRMMIVDLDAKTFARAYRLYMRREAELSQAVVDAIDMLALPDEIGDLRVSGGKP